MGLRVKKVFNNNALLVEDNGAEKIVMGSGIGFQKKVKDIVPIERIEKIFEPKEEKEYEAFKKILETIPTEHIRIAEKIINYAEEKLETRLKEHIHIVLADHISFALERISSGLNIKNKLLNEIALLYKKEFEIGKWAVEIINEELSTKLPIDEAGYIALHIHTVYTNSTLEESIDAAKIIRDMIDIIQGEMNIDIDKDILSYERLVTHLRFALQRKEDNKEFHDLDLELILMIKEKYTQSYACAVKIRDFLKDSYNIYFDETELCYISLHIERIRKKP